MYRINKVCIDLLLLLILSVSSLSAQVAIVTSEGYPAIDLSELEPMGAVLSSAEADLRRKEMYELTPSSSATLVPDFESVSGTEGRWNAKMSMKYQVMRANLGTSSNWISAWQGCMEYADEGGVAGSWRLPTLRELMMIMILHPQLIENGGFEALNNYYYWCVTEQSANFGISMSIQSMIIGRSIKSSRNRVRCVRDI